MLAPAQDPDHAGAKAGLSKSNSTISTRAPAGHSGVCRSVSVCVTRARMHAVKEEQCCGYDAMSQWTSPTVLRAGLKINQVPSEAIMKIDGRTLPGQSAQDIVDEIRAVIGPGFEITIDSSADPTVTDADDPIAARIREVMDRQAPGGIVLPMLIPGFTDAKAYSQLGTRCWGFSPVQLDAEMSFSSMFHGHNERIPVAGFHFGVRALFDLVTTLVL